MILGAGVFSIMGGNIGTVVISVEVRHSIVVVKAGKLSRTACVRRDDRRGGRAEKFNIPLRVLLKLGIYVRDGKQDEE